MVEGATDSVLKKMGMDKKTRDQVTKAIDAGVEGDSSQDVPNVQ